MGDRLINRWGFAALTVVGALVASGCEGGEEARTEPASPAPMSGPVAVAPSAEPEAPIVRPVRRDVDRLTTRDLRPGDGRAAGRTSAVLLRFVAVDARSGSSVESTYGEGAPFLVELGAGLLPPGLERGVAGMREGGRRRVEVPRKLSGAGRPVVYVVDLVKIL